jgi:hypothetical protein
MCHERKSFLFKILKASERILALFLGSLQALPFQLVGVNDVAIPSLQIPSRSLWFYGTFYPRLAIGELVGRDCILVGSVG